MSSRPLVALNPRWLATDRSGQPHVGLAFACPCCPADALEVQALFRGTPGPGLRHLRTGESFETVSLTPEVTCPAGHRVWITLGEAIVHEGVCSRGHRSEAEARACAAQGEPDYGF